tara:strand:- start:8 stop:901 length:894 start_codon:yes stop_codon:yes gene_type:complete
MALTKISRGLLNTGVSDSSDATAITIDSSENVGIATTSPGGILDIKKSYSGNTLLSRLWNSEDTNSASNAEFRIVSGNAATPILTFGDSGAVRHSISVDSSDNLLFKHTGSTERMRITSGGDIGVNMTTPNAKFAVTAGSGGYASYMHFPNGSYGMGMNCTSSGVNVFHYYFSNSTYVGQVYTTGSATIWSSASDYRLKENVVTDWDATTRLQQLKPSRFNFIADPDTTWDGFLAHEVSDIVPEATIGEKDEVDEDGNPKYQSMDNSKLVPLLVKALQESNAKIEALETRIETLENA